ncbi:hypothetical protein [Algoriphagus litoralis]|uniref:hypothetical protein n=1 Tax=Algoriphagus litoralis TaxID=2202829 RepID=UPI000DB91060|nr:hypothetical protein [Algoriphagus litoralis]
MKKLVLSITSLFVLTCTWAQSTETKETLLNGVNLSQTGFMLASTVGAANWDGANVGLWTNRAGVVFADKFSLGGFYSFSVNDFVPDSETTSSTYMDFRWVGGFLEYTLKAGKKAHLTFPVLVGGAELELDQESGSRNQFGEANFLMVEPAVLLELNLLSNLRFHIGGGYRIVGDFSYRNLGPTDLSGFTAQAGIKLGIFN